MTWILFALTLTVASLLSAAFFLQERSGKSTAKVYRQRYLRLIERLEELVGSVRRVEGQITESRDVRLADQFLSLLRMLETLMGAIKTMAPFGLNPDVLAAPTFLVQDLQERVGRLEHNIIAQKKGRTVLGALGHHGPAQSHLGCYFCSRSFEPSLFLKVRVRVDGKASEVAACNVCNHVLQGKKKAKVLFFQEEGKPVHWSLAKDYIPNEQYWNINAPEAVSAGRQTTSSHLTLVYSNISALDAGE